MTELETMQRAKMYMDKLAQGIDPISGLSFPEDSALNNVRLARCFFYVSGILEQVIANGGHVGVTEKTEFSIMPEQLAKVEIVPRPIRITEFANALYRAVEDPGMKKPNVVRVANWLTAKGFLMKELGPDGKNRRVPTAEGIRLGLSTQMRSSPEGEYLAVYYNDHAQRFLLDHLDSILRDK